jgi:hypothetical protein
MAESSKRDANGITRFQIFNYLLSKLKQSSSSSTAQHSPHATI